MCIRITLVGLPAIHAVHWVGGTCFNANSTKTASVYQQVSCSLRLIHPHRDIYPKTKVILTVVVNIVVCVCLVKVDINSKPHDCVGSRHICEYMNVTLAPYLQCSAEWLLYQQPFFQECQRPCSPAVHKLEFLQADCRQKYWLSVLLRCPSERHYKILYKKKILKRL